MAGEHDITLPMSKLDDLAGQKGPSTPHYIPANQALRDDLTAFLSLKFEFLVKKLMYLKDEVKKCHQRELKLEQQIQLLTSKTALNVPPTKNDIYLVGSSILREVRSDDLVNGTVKSISGGKIKDIKEDITTLKVKPKTKIS